MKKMTILAVILALAIALTACGSKTKPEETVSGTIPAATVAVETGTPVQPLTLTSWTLSASTWSSPNGATIHLSATPNYYEESNQADFVVRLESDDVAAIPCQWDGANYTASADLNAANGYCYYVVLTAADGTVSEVAVNTPAVPTNETFINMEASLESYCSVTIEESTFEKGKLTLSGGNVQVKAPLITNNGAAITCEEVVLILTLNGEELDKETLALEQTEADGVFEAALDKISFDVPEMENDQKVELTMRATLSNGQELSAYGANWVYNTDGLLPVVG